MQGAINTGFYMSAHVLFLLHTGFDRNMRMTYDDTL